MFKEAQVLIFSVYLIMVIYYNPRVTLWHHVLESRIVTKINLELRPRYFPTKQLSLMFSDFSCKLTDFVGIP